MQFYICLTFCATLGSALAEVDYFYHGIANKTIEGLFKQLAHKDPYKEDYRLIKHNNVILEARDIKLQGFSKSHAHYINVSILKLTVHIIFLCPKMIVFMQNCDLNENNNHTKGAVRIELQNVKFDFHSQISITKMCPIKCTGSFIMDNAVILVTDISDPSKEKNPRFKEMAKDFVTSKYLKDVIQAELVTVCKDLC